MSKSEDRLIRLCTRRRISLATLLQIAGNVGDMTETEGDEYFENLRRVLESSRNEAEFCQRTGIYNYRDLLPV